MSKKAATKLLIGIQGGEGSFNDEAIHKYCQGRRIKNYEIRYLFTTKRVLKALHEKKIDRGMFATENSGSGTVWETINAMSRYNCKIIENYRMQVNQCLLGQKGTELKDIKVIMSHPQAILQCKNNLKKKFPRKKLASGKGNLIDTAAIAKYLASLGLPKTTAVIASQRSAKLYGLKVLAKNLQDRHPNLTSFLFVKRWNGEGELKW